MTSPFLLEQAMLNAWPALQSEHLNGFVMRYANGHTKRSNAATPLYACDLPFETLAKEVKTRYRRASLTPLFRMTPLSPNGLDDYLAAQGWERFEETRGMAMTIPKNLTLTKVEEAILTLEESVSLQWVQGAAKAYGFEPWQEEILFYITQNIRLPAVFCTVYVDKRPVGYGLAVQEGDLVGLYDLAIDPAMRGKGLGKRLITSLLHWGRSKGATIAYLQVREANIKAWGLYEKLGFETAYTYHHRRFVG